MSDKDAIRPVLKAADNGSPISHIYFDEWIDVPQCKTAQVRLLFDCENSFEEMQELVSELDRRGLRFVLEPVK